MRVEKAVQGIVSVVLLINLINLHLADLVPLRVDRTPVAETIGLVIQRVLTDRLLLDPEHVTCELRLLHGHHHVLGEVTSVLGSLGSEV